MPRTLILIGLALCVALAAASTASAGAADDPPSVFASAELRNLELISSVLVFDKAVDQRGGWFDNSVSCLQKRLLHVRVSLNYLPSSGPTRRIVRKKRARPRNCAEGGPNLGFTISARPHNLACPDGTWKPGTYTHITRTTHRKTGLRAIAVLTWTKIGSC